MIKTENSEFSQVIEVISNLKQIEINDLKEQLDNNAKSLFKKLTFPQ